MLEVIGGNIIDLLIWSVCLCGYVFFILKGIVHSKMNIQDYRKYDFKKSQRKKMQVKREDHGEADISLRRQLAAHLDNPRGLHSNTLIKRAKNITERVVMGKI